ncbi:hypothetical protein [Candidatus Deianiraea vastatrix]|uniref:Uncharacterized protein n=1 Tax=Candidatus Deianiraea vastatrix TaxID=2163644 RepID=A0A5B8XBU1_9RICK|nr:hypothetical protein [Candidatus Deianiraea vastatrix]QED22822.1 hypothetical protein Deia_00008 [Candidatus Deianiraea vastatrix]
MRDNYFLIKKRTFLDIYWHYIVVTIAMMFSIGFIKDESVIVQCLGIFDCSLISYIYLKIGKKFNIFYLIGFSILHETFLDCIYGVCIISYFIAVFACFKLKKSGLIRYFRLFNEDSKMLYMTSMCTFIICQESFLLINGRSVFYIFGEIIVSFALLRFYEMIFQKYNKKHDRFKNYANSSSDLLKNR